MTFAVWIENRTPFAAATHVQLNADGQEVLVVMFSASFDALDGAPELRVSEDQMPVALRDIPFGDPANSSNRYEADIAPVKPGAEFLMNGTAYAQKGRPVAEMQVGVRVGSLQKVLNVVGDRIYDAGSYSAPQPFLTMPVVYERAYGGTQPDGRLDQRNPVGIGYHHARSADPCVRTQAPNIAYPDEPYLRPSDRPKPAGFGPLGRGWLPRLPLAGTYDQAWIDTQWPLPPKDFDPRYNLSAPADQHLQQIEGGEPVTVIGMTPTGRWDFRLPRVVAPIQLIYDDRVEQQRFKADTVIIEPDLWRVTLKARLALVTRRGTPQLRQIAFGHVTSGFLLAARKRKAYIDPRGTGGVVDRPVWQP
ncbi:DUF2169 domain-containing protein [Mesorhizobium sp. BR1-1-16]|uniref:DUF2169 family type VI secretion system accessory protein n=1 Tax=Mesorhizobium sp. BR1-1-16 TaxID=2876653 RepID=UPI001CCC6FDC|nr:DUF2169 domain-containing protein [Mesorhizobium sp. BR1-1-16]MBZ9936334.1 DUF2169 domain-containing protein [Mesorhizobium sp. BR1-1-16]